jgi:hypothetical protein
MTPALPRRAHGLTGSSAASMVLDLANRLTIDPSEAITVLDLRIVSSQQVTEFRHEYQLGSNYLWADATAIVGGKHGEWRVIDLVPRELSLAAFRLDPPHEVRPHLKHTTDGTMVAALEYMFRVKCGELSIRTVGQTMRIERVTLTTRT